MYERDIWRRDMGRKCQSHHPSIHLFLPFSLPSSLFFSLSIFNKFRNSTGHSYRTYYVLSFVAFSIIAIVVVVIIILLVASIIIFICFLKSLYLFKYSFPIDHFHIFNIFFFSFLPLEMIKF